MCLNRNRKRYTCVKTESFEAFNFGDKECSLGTSCIGLPQDFEKLRKKHLRKGTLFDDESFPASDESFYINGRGPKKFEWLRPHELVKRPRFIKGDANRFDVNQGELGNCWLLAALANLTMHRSYFKRVVPQDQSFCECQYAGIFHFRFWQYGRWIDVCIDDKLPTINGKLVMMHSGEADEFWGSLLEKAYAKFHGSYESLKGGITSEAMEDFTGGLNEFFELRSQLCPPDLGTILLKAYKRGSLMGCSIIAESSSQREAILVNGLIKGHAYSINAVKRIDLNNKLIKGQILLLRIRNPWGNEVEWNGSWSDNSREWTVLPNKERQELGLKFENDGEFWMSFQDFKANFTHLEITNLTPDSSSDSKKAWQTIFFQGHWIPEKSAGGCRNYLDTFEMNPQYTINLIDPDEEDDEELCTCVVALMQKDRRAKRIMGLNELTIGFVIYKVNENADGIQRKSNGKIRLTRKYFENNSWVAHSAYNNSREVTGRYRFKPGLYCIIPSTFHPHKQGDFIIRIFTETACHSCD